MSGHLVMDDGSRLPDAAMRIEAQALVDNRQVVDALDNETDYLVGQRVVSLALGASCCSCVAPQPCVHVTAARLHRNDTWDARRQREADRDAIRAARAPQARDRAQRRSDRLTTIRLTVGGTAVLTGLLVLAAADHGLNTTAGLALFAAGTFFTLGTKGIAALGERALDWGHRS